MIFTAGETVCECEWYHDWLGDVPNGSNSICPDAMLPALCCTRKRLVQTGQFLPAGPQGVLGVGKQEHEQA